MRLLVTGGRDFTDRARLWRVLNTLNPRVLIQGGALGADALAEQWAKDYPNMFCIDRRVSALRREIISEPVTRQEWDMFGGMAGPIRNARMLLHHPDLVLACPGGRGTADMITRAREACIPVVGLL